MRQNPKSPSRVGGTHLQQPHWTFWLQGIRNPRRQMLQARQMRTAHSRKGSISQKLLGSTRNKWNTGNIFRAQEEKNGNDPHGSLADVVSCLYNQPTKHDQILVEKGFLEGSTSGAKLRNAPPRFNCRTSSFLVFFNDLQGIVLRCLLLNHQDQHVRLCFLLFWFMVLVCFILLNQFRSKLGSLHSVTVVAKELELL